MLVFLKNLPLKGLGGRCLSVIGPLGWYSKFCGFRILSITQCITPVYMYSPHNLIPFSPPTTPPPVTHCIITYPCTYSHRERGGGSGRSTSEKVRGAQVHKRGRKYQHDLLYHQSINSIKYNKGDIYGLVSLYLVHAPVYKLY